MHVLALPVPLVVLFALHAALALRNKPAQFAGPGRPSRQPDPYRHQRRRHGVLRRAIGKRRADTIATRFSLPIEAVLRLGPLRLQQCVPIGNSSQPRSFPPLFLTTNLQVAASTVSGLALGTLIYRATGSPLLSASACTGPPSPR
jgi:hypothetical protein